MEICANFICSNSRLSGDKEWLGIANNENPEELNVHYSSGWNTGVARTVIFEKEGELLRLFIDGELLIESQVLLPFGYAGMSRVGLKSLPMQYLLKVLKCTEKVCQKKQCQQLQVTHLFKW